MESTGAHGTDATGLGAAIAARKGNTKAATAGIAALKSITGPYHFGRQLLWAARVASVLGDAERARGFLRGAFARGLPYDIELHADMDLADVGTPCPTM